jgi:hypothetical protein
MITDERPRRRIRDRLAPAVRPGGALERRGPVPSLSAPTWEARVWRDQAMYWYRIAQGLADRLGVRLEPEDPV